MNNATPRLCRFAVVAAAAILSFPAQANVSLRSGNFFVGYTDVVYQGGFEMKVERVYNSKTAFKGIFGWGWGFEHEVCLELTDDGTAIISHEYGGGAEDVFRAETPAPIDLVVEKIVSAADRLGEFGSDEQTNAYREKLSSNETFRHDEFRRLTRLRVLLPPVAKQGATFVSDRFGHQTIVRLREGYERKFEQGQKRHQYDDAGRLTYVSDANGRSITLTYERTGTPSSCPPAIERSGVQPLAEMRDDTGRVLKFKFTQRGLVESITDSRDRTARFEYNGESELVHSVDVDGNDYRFEYSNDRRHNLTAIRYGDGTSMEMTYTPVEQNENIASVKDRDGTLTRYSYTNFEKGHFTVGVDVVDEKGNPESNSSYEYRHRYDAAGGEHLARLVTTVDGEVTDTTYNDTGLPVRIARGTDVATFAYDDHGRVTRRQTATETTELQYDPVAGKVARVKRTRDGATSVYNYGYDIKGNLVRAADEHGLQIELSYDGKGQIAVMSARRKGEKQPENIRFTYNGNGKPTTIAADGLGEIHVTYSESGEIDRVESSAGRSIAVKITSMFQELLDVIRPAGVSLSL